jgi:hypothetical protein
LPVAQQYALPLLKQVSQTPSPLWPRRKLAADALLAKSIITVPKSARDVERTRLRTRCAMADAPAAVLAAANQIIRSTQAFDRHLDNGRC